MDTESIIAQATRAYLAGDSHAAAIFCRQVLQHTTEQIDALHLLAVTELCLGRTDGAIRLLRQVVRIDANSAAVHSTLGVVFRIRGRLDEAESCLRLATRLDPQSAQFHNNLGLVCRDLGRTDEAARHFEQALEIDRSHVAACVNLSSLLRSQGRRQEALRLLATVAHCGPSVAPICELTGTLLVELRELEQAEPYLREATSLHPDSARSWCLLGQVLQQTGRPTESILALNQSLALDPTIGESHFELAQAYTTVGAHADAVRHLKLLLDSHPDRGLMHLQLGQALYRLGAVDDALAQFHEAVNHGQTQQGLEAIASLIPCAVRADLKRVRTLRQAWVSRFVGSTAAADSKRSSGSTLRVAFLCGLPPDSAEYGAFLDVIAALAEERIHAHLLLDHPRSHPSSERLRGQPAQNISSLTNRELGELCRSERFDILVDMTDPIDSRRQRLLATAPAPAIVSWLTASGTSALPAVRHFLADSHLVAEHEEQFYTERIWRMPGCHVALNPPLEAAAASSRRPAIESSSEAPPKLGCLCHQHQLSQPLTQTWISILKSTPASLHICSTEFSSRGNRNWYLQRFRNEGLSEDRVQLTTPTEFRSQREFFETVDVLLDPFPMSSGLRNFEPLWSGIPVISLAGKCFPGRTTSTLLTASGLGQFACQTPQEYHRLAVELVEQTLRDGLESVRGEIQAAMRSSPITDVATFARHLKTVLESIHAS